MVNPKHTNFKYGTVNHFDMLKQTRAEQVKAKNKMFEDEAFTERVIDIARRKPYHEEYREVVEGKAGVKNLLYLLHALQIALGIFGFAGWIFDKFENIVVAYAIAFSVLAFIEWAVHKTLIKVARTISRGDTPPPFPTAITLVFMGLIVFGDYWFSDDISRTFVQKPPKVNELAVTDAYAAKEKELKAKAETDENKLRNDAADTEAKATIMENGKPIILYNQRKNVNAAKNRVAKVSEDLSANLQRLDTDKKADIERLNGGYSADLSEYTTKIENSGKTAKGMTVIVAVLLIVCIWFVSHFYIKAAEEMFGVDWDSIEGFSPTQDDEGDNTGGNDNSKKRPQPQMEDENQDRKPNIDIEIPTALPQNKAEPETEKVQLTARFDHVPPFQMEFDSQEAAEKWKSHIHPVVPITVEKQRNNTQNTVIRPLREGINLADITNELDTLRRSYRTRISQRKLGETSGYRGRSKSGIDRAISDLEAQISDLEAELALFSRTQHHTA